MSETKTRARKILAEEKGVYKKFEDGSILLYGRASYPWIAKPQKNTNDNTGAVTEKYNISVMLDKETHLNAMKACRDAIRGLEKQMAAKGKTGGKGKDGKPKPFKYQASKKFIKDADVKDPSSDESLFYPKNPEYEGNWIIRASSDDQPQMRGNQKDPETGKPVRLTSQQASKLFQGGNYVAVLIRPWPQDNDYGIRANAELLAVQFVRKGEPFGNARRLDDDDIDDSLDADDDADNDSGGWGEDDDDL